LPSRFFYEAVAALEIGMFQLDSRKGLKAQGGDDRPRKWCDQQPGYGKSLRARPRRSGRLLKEIRSYYRRWCDSPGVCIGKRLECKPVIRTLRLKLHCQAVIDGTPHSGVNCTNWSSESGGPRQSPHVVLGVSRPTWARVRRKRNPNCAVVCAAKDR